MSRYKIPAVFMRGGTSKGVFFKATDLPSDRAERDRIFLTVLGSPDPYGRQLDGMGGGISSLSKAVVIEPSSRADADVDFTFIQVAVDRPIADYEQTCGNLSAAVGPFAVEEGIVSAADGEAVVRVFNTNTAKIYHARFAVRGGVPVERGDFTMSGVSGTGARVRLDYMNPGGARTSAFLPSGNVIDLLPDGTSHNHIETSLVDATSPVVFVRASDLGVTGTEPPEALEANGSMTSRLEAIRRDAAVVMGLAELAETAALSTPKIAMVSAPAPYTTIGGEKIAAEDHDIAVRIVSMERLHKAVTGTGAMCLAAACQVPNSLPAGMIGRSASSKGTGDQEAGEKEAGGKGTVTPGGAVRIGTPSGVLTVAASVSRTENGIWQADRVTVYRTQRRLMEGSVVLPREPI